MTDAIGHIDELESVDSLVDLLNFIRDENMNTGLLLQPKVQAIVKNSFRLLNRNKHQDDESASGSKLNNLKRALQTESEMHSKSQAHAHPMQLNLQFAKHASNAKTGVDHEIRSVSRGCISPNHRQTDQSNLLGSPVNVLDLSAINHN